jgi:tRNA (guanine-N7-)-methyltransferase
MVEAEARAEAARRRRDVHPAAPAPAAGGLLDFRTDVERYADDAVVRLEEAGFENERGPGRFSEHDPGEIPSTREKRYLATGQPVWRLRMHRPMEIR